MNNTQHVTQLQSNTVHSETHMLQNCNYWLSDRMTYLLKYYISAFTNTKPVHTHIHTLFGIISLGVDAVSCHAQDTVWQFTLLYVAQSHDKKGEFVRFFLKYWFWATGHVSTRDNWYNCALSTWREIFMETKPSLHTKLPIYNNMYF